MNDLSALTLYVAMNGCDLWTGTRPTPAADGKDGPLQTIERAVAVARTARAPGRPVAIEIQGGEYPLNRGVRLAEQDSGRPVAPLEIRAAPGARVCLLGGRGRAIRAGLRAHSLRGYWPVRNHGRPVQTSLTRHRI